MDGLIIVPATDDHSYLSSEQRAGLSLVFVDRRPQLLRADAVISDNVAGAHAAVKHLIAVGHRRIGFLADLRQIETASERLAGYAQALTEFGIELDEDLVKFDLHEVEAAEAAARSLLLGPRPTALFATQNLITIGAIRALRDLALHERIALVGFDDLPLADLLQPAITVIAQDPTSIGTRACELLFQRMEGDTSPTHTDIVPTRLIARGSGEIGP